VTNVGSGTVTALDLGKREIIKHIVVGEGAEGIALAPDGKSVYATATKDNRLSRIDTDSLTVVAQVATDATPIRVEPTPDGKRVVINNAGAGTLQIFDAATLAELKRIKIGQLPIGLSVPSNERAYVARMNHQKISVVDLQRLEVVGEVPTGRLPDGLVYLPTVK
jgi:YVTN family beta-propeller protein